MPRLILSTPAPALRGILASDIWRRIYTEDRKSFLRILLCAFAKRYQRLLDLRNLRLDLLSRLRRRTLLNGLAWLAWSDELDLFV